MNTFLLAHNYTDDSFAAMSYHFAHYIAKKGNRVVFISHKPHFEFKQILKEGKGELIVLSWPTKKRPTTLRDVFWFIKIFINYKPKTIIGHFVGSNISAIVAKFFSFWNSKTIVYYHTLSQQIRTDSKISAIKQKILNYRKKIFYLIFCDLIICPSKMSELDLYRVYNIQKSKVILNSISDRYKTKSQISGNKIIISYLGRLDPSKGVKELIEAFKKYKLSFPDSKLLLNIAGGGTLEKFFKEMTNEIDGIRFLGPLKYSEIDDYLCNSHFTVIPSLFDNLPTVGLESLMNATPLLISSNTGLTEYLTEGENCFKFNINDNSLFELFGKLETLNEELITMRINARETYQNLFSMEKYCENFSQVI